ncbi:MAG: hypothetical protein RLZZ584_282 [Pseudomonadota bacterium]
MFLNRLLNRHLPLAAAAVAAVLLPAALARAVEVSTFGPSGGAGGEPLKACSVTLIDGVPLRISEIRVRSGDYIDAIQLVYSNGKVGPRQGGLGGRLSSFRLEPDETVTIVSGRYGDHVDSLAITTSKGRTQRWGGSGGTAAYSYTAPAGMWVGDLTGRAGQYLDAIGVCIVDPR